MTDTIGMAYQFKIQIKGISKPPVWRRLIVPGNFSFHQFHLAIQYAFGWYNCHLYEFPLDWYSGLSIQLPYEGIDPDEMDSQKTKLNKIFKSEGDQLAYIYDFGDWWEHSILLEKIIPGKMTRPSCTGGKGKCPPEDCGGNPGYQNFLKIFNDPANPEYEGMREWAWWIPEDQEWDPKEFDLEWTNEVVSTMDYSK